MGLGVLLAYPCVRYGNGHSVYICGVNWFVPPSPAWEIKASPPRAQSDTIASQLWPAVPKATASSCRRSAFVMLQSMQGLVL